MKKQKKNVHFHYNCVNLHENGPYYWFGVKNRGSKKMKHTIKRAQDLVSSSIIYPAMGMAFEVVGIIKKDNFEKNSLKVAKYPFS